MTILISSFVFLCGTVFGSFYNVVIYRIPKKMSVAEGRSMCPSCEHTLLAIDLVPILSWFLLKGKCRYCNEKISSRYAIIEFVTGCLFLLAYITQGIGIRLILYAAFWSMLLIVTMMDIDEMVVSEQVLLIFTAICVVCLLILGQPIVDHLLGFAVGFGVYLLIYVLARIAYKKEGFGFGDVELMGSMGLVLGLRGSIQVLFLSFYIALFGIIILKIIGMSLKRMTEIPFGPYMCAAGFIVSLYEQPIYDFFEKIMLGS